MTQWKIPLADVSLNRGEIDAVTQVLRSGWLSMGPKTKEFEDRFAEFMGVKHAFAVANGTVALHLACHALGLKEGDEILCPSLTFVATANAIRYTGARPVFIDINGTLDLNLSVEDAATKVTERTKAIMLVHYGGYPCDMDSVRILAEQHDLKIIEDAAHAPGSFYHSRDGLQMLGTIGAVGCFSFFSNKNMTTGEGGMVVTNDAELAERIRIARSHGMTTLTWDRHRGHSFSYDVVATGFNYRLDDLRAALGIVQLSRLEAANAQRRRLSALYRKELRAVQQVQIPFPGEMETSACHIFPVILPAEVDRRKFMEYLAGSGIQTSIHYPPIHQFTHYRQLWPADFDHGLPYTEDVAQREVTLPLFPSMTTEQVEEVVRVVKKFFQET